MMLERCGYASCVGVVVANFAWGSRHVAVILGGVTVLGVLSFFCHFLLKKFHELMKCLHLFVSNVRECGGRERIWRSCVNSRAAMVAFSVDYLYGIFP